MKYRVKLKALNKSSDGPINGSCTATQKCLAKEQKTKTKENRERWAGDKKRQSLKMTYKRIKAHTHVNIKNANKKYVWPTEPYQKETSLGWACCSVHPL